MTASTTIGSASTSNAGVPPAPSATLQPAASKPQGLKAFESFTVPLSRLVIADENVRTSDDSPVDELASLIDSQGLLQDLTVIPARGKRGTRSRLFGVVAGGRRLRALWLLRDRGRIAADEPIGCKLREAADATAVSLAENSGRAAMHPADEFQAFAKLQAEGRSVEDIAACFGCTPLVVQRRLKLSNAAPSMLALYRSGDMQLDQLMALCLTDDPAAQIAAWEATPYDRSAHSLRRRLTESKVSTTSPVARFVTVAAYEAAGGTVHRDLFADDGAGFILDPQLLDQLVAQRLQALADEVRAEGWAWVEVRAVLSYSDTSAFQTLPRRRLPATEEQARDLAALEATSDRLNAELEALYDTDGEGDEHTVAVDAKEAECNAANEAFEAADEALKGYGPEAFQHAGALVGIDRNGAATVHRGLVRPADRRALALAVERAARAADGLADDLVDDGDESGSAQQAGQADGEPLAKGLSEVLMRRLTAQRTLAIQAMLADNAQVALAALANVLVARLIEDDLHIHQPRTAVQVSAQGSRSTVLAAAPEATQSRAFETLAERVTAWRDRIPGDAGRRLGWLIALPQGDLVDLLALFVALSTDAVTGKAGRHAVDALVAPLGLDMADWWEPTAENYLAHVPKAKAIEAVAQARGAAAAEPLSKLKKTELVIEAERLLVGSRWLPAELVAQGR